MAYTPTRADFLGADMGQPKSGGYRPTRADFMQEESKPKEESHWWNSVGEKKNDLSDRSMYSLMRQQSPLGPSHNPDPGKANYNIGEKAGEFGLDMLPWLVPGTAAEKLAAKAISKSPALAAKAMQFAENSPRLAKFLPGAANNIGTGAAYNAVNAQPGNIGKAATTGGIYGGLSTLLPYPLNWGGQYIAKKYAQSAIPEFTSRATNKLREVLPLDAAAQKLEGLYKSAVGKNKDNWTKTEGMAKELDNSLKGPMRSEGKLVSGKDRNKIQTEVENTDLMGNKLNPRFSGKDSSNVPANIKPEIVGYDAGGAPIMNIPAHDFSVAQKEIPGTIRISGKEGRKTPAMSGQYDAAGAPTYREGIDFSNSPYGTYIDNFKNKVGAMEPAIKEPYKQSLGVADKAKEMSPQSFSGAVQLSKNINQTMKDHLSDGGKAINPQNSQSTQFLTGLKNTLRNDVVDANKDKVGAEALGQFKNQWEAANKSHQDVQEFYKSFQNSTATIKPTRQMRERFQNAVKADPNLIGKFMPSLTDKGAKGVEGFDHLAKLMGSKKDAQDAAKAYIFQGQINNGAKTVDAAAQYAKLSGEQKKWMFGNSEEGRLLEAINNTRKAFGREPNKTLEKVGHGIISWTAPGIVAGGASYASGDSAGKSATNAALATLASKGIGHIAGKTATERSVERALRMKNSVPTNGKYINLVTQHLLNSKQDN